MGKSEVKVTIRDASVGFQGERLLAKLEAQDRIAERRKWKMTPPQRPTLSVRLAEKEVRGQEETILMLALFPRFFSVPAFA